MGQEGTGWNEVEWDGLRWYGGGWNREYGIGWDGKEWYGTVWDDEKEWVRMKGDILHIG